MSYFPEGLVPLGDRLLNEIFDRKPFKRFGHLHVITDDHPYCPPVPHDSFRIFSMTRFMWKTPFPPGRSEAENKGNDIMLKGIVLFLERYSGPVEIHFVEKGLHVPESKQLIEDLGFANRVTWHKEMPFKALFDHVAETDVVFEQLGSHYISGGFYAMLQGRPVIGNAHPEIFDKLTGEPTPVCHARTAEEVAEWLSHLAADREKAKEIGIRFRQYILNHFDIQNESKYFKDFLEAVLTKLK